MRRTRFALIPLAFAAVLTVASAQEATHSKEPLPACTYDDLPARVLPEGDGRYTVLDTVFRLPADWVPDDLVPLTEAGFDDTRSVRAVLLPDLIALREAATLDGVQLEVVSAYRSYDYQARTFQYWTEVAGEEAALTTSARAGHSEHQLGTALDFATAGGPAPWDLEDWAATLEGAWMQTHAPSYGFVLSYPVGAEQTACYGYEPWHWRWVGRELADEIHRADVVPRRALWQRYVNVPEGNSHAE